MTSRVSAVLFICDLFSYVRPPERKFLYIFFISKYDFFKAILVNIVSFHVFFPSIQCMILWNKNQYNLGHDLMAIIEENE